MMPRVFHQEKETRLLQGDRIILEMDKGIGTISRKGYPLDFQTSDSPRPQMVYRFKVGELSDVKQAERFLELIGYKDVMRVIRVPFTKPNASCFDLISGGSDAG